MINNIYHFFLLNALLCGLLLFNVLLVSVNACYASPIDKIAIDNMQWIKPSEKKYGEISTRAVFYKFNATSDQPITFKFYIRSADAFGTLAHLHFFDPTGKKLSGNLDTPLIYETKDWVIYQASFIPKKAQDVFIIKVSSQRPITYKLILNGDQENKKKSAMITPNVPLLAHNQSTQKMLQANTIEYYRIPAPPNAQLHFDVKTRARKPTGSIFTLDFLTIEGGKLAGGINPIVYETERWKSIPLQLKTNAESPPFYILRLQSNAAMEYKIGFKIAYDATRTVNTIAKTNTTSVENIEKQVKQPTFTSNTSTILNTPDTSVTTEKRFALVMGNNHYQNLGSLRNAGNDATDISKLLAQRNFKVRLLVNGTQKQMIQYIRDFSHELQKGGVGLFYYAGHGVQVSGENYLLPVNADIKATHEVKPEGVNVQRVLAAMSAANNRLNIVILDACRNNPFLQQRQQAKRSIDIPIGLAEMRASSGMMIAYSTSPGEIALDGKERNGIYTKHLLQQIKQPNIEMSQMFKRVRKFVRAETKNKQTPWESTSVEGDFYFTPLG